MAAEEVRRTFSPCWVDAEGALNSLEPETSDREYAEERVAWWRSEENGRGGAGMRVVLGTHLTSSWVTEGEPE